jgi:hypothetical protein
MKGKLGEALRDRPDFKRWAELEAFADKLDITVDKAIVMLVRKGLSHV